MANDFINVFASTPKELERKILFYRRNGFKTVGEVYKSNFEISQAVTRDYKPLRLVAPTRAITGLQTSELALEA